MNHEYFRSLAKLKFTLQEKQSNHDSMNIPKIEFISLMKAFVLAQPFGFNTKDWDLFHLYP